jgi:hypothetical protein
MYILVAIYSAVLFFVLSPGVFLRLPQNGSKMIVTAVHAAILGMILYLTENMIWRMSIDLEGMQEGYITEKAKCISPNKWKKNKCRNANGNRV